MRKFNLKCKKGFVVRKGFTKKNGTKVRATCIKKKAPMKKKTRVKKKKTPLKKKKTPVKKKKTSVKKKKTPMKKKKTPLKKKKTLVKKNKAPMKKKKTPVKKKKTSVKKKEQKQLKKVIIPISKTHELSKYGYKNIKELGVRKRHKALSNSVNEYEAKKVLSKLGAIKTLHKNKSPELATKYLNNMVWLRNKFDSHFKGKLSNSKLSKSV